MPLTPVPSPVVVLLTTAPDTDAHASPHHDAPDLRARSRRGAADPHARPQLYSSWHSLNKAWTERYTRLEEQLQAAVTYQDNMQVGAGDLPHTSASHSRSAVWGGSWDHRGHG